MTNEPRRQASDSRDISTLEAAMTHAREIRAKRAVAMNPELQEPHVVLMPETEQEYATAEKRLTEQLRASNARKVELGEMDQERYYFFVRCEREVNSDRSPHHGVYLEEPYPDGNVPPGKWWATYLERGKRYLPGMAIICQQCEKLGRPCHLPVIPDGRGGFWVDLAHIWKVPKDYDEYIAEGASRVHDLPFASCNMWRVEHGPKVQKALEIRHQKFAARSAQAVKA